MQQILEGSRAVAETIKNIKPAVISAYPITPQTHIVEDLAKYKADGKVGYDYVRAESEFAAASIVEGASAGGVRVYTATSSQGLLLMTEVIFNIAGMRLPVVLTCANRGVSAPITIWNDHQDAMTVRDAGWLMFFAENHQESVWQHILAYKLAEKLRLPAMINIDGFILTHSYEPVNIPTEKEIKKFLPDYKPDKDAYLNPANPFTMGAFATPKHYMEIRQELNDNLTNAKEQIKIEYKKLLATFKTDTQANDNGLIEYTGSKKAKTIIIAMGSQVGTIKEAIKNERNVGVLKIKAFRPFPEEEIFKYTKKAKNIIVMEKAISLGNAGPLAGEVRACLQEKSKANIKSCIVGLGGRDITTKLIKKVLAEAKNKEDLKFYGN